MDILNEGFPSLYSKKEDFPQPRIVTIASIAMVDVGMEGHPEMKPVMYFHDADVKPVIINKTNATSLAAQLGNETTAWTNRQVVIYNDPTVVYQGKVGGIRLRLPDPVQPAQQPAYQVPQTNAAPAQNPSAAFQAAPQPAPVQPQQNPAAAQTNEQWLKDYGNQTAPADPNDDIPV